jgi:hypothetical protein
LIINKKKIGKGIEIFRSLRDIMHFMAQKPLNTLWVAQKYIEKPLLYQGRKFDIRVWVLITEKQEVFFYQSGYLRTSSDNYSMTNFNNYIHLTNNCLQKFGNNYGQHEPGNTLSFEDLQKYIDEKYPQFEVNVHRDILSRMKDLIIDTFLSVKNTINPNKRDGCFELFGYDFLIDEDFRTWLIEVNTNPYFGIPNTFIKGLLPQMIDHMIEIILDPLFPPPKWTSGITKF